MTKNDAIEQYGSSNPFLLTLEKMDWCYRCVGDGAFTLDPCPDCAGTGKQSVAERVGKLRSFQ